MRILLTGANGFIGQHLLRALLAEGHHVVSAGRSAPKGAARLDSIHADFVHDTEQSVWLARLSGIEAVIKAIPNRRRNTGAISASGSRSASRRLSLSS